MTRKVIPVTLTSYWPFDVRGASEAKMEGGWKDRRGHRLITLQEHLEDPITWPYVSVAGDYTVWPYGIRIALPDVHATAIFRVVDTGGHFFGKGKVWRNEGHEPLDICVQTRANNIGPVISTAYVIDE